ncbi:MAG: AsmA family protein, partial [Alphaproteobacteria bacterium]|nr:AsmA family protein [Alphaproteobacteria bacterium]
MRVATLLKLLAGLVVLVVAVVIVALLVIDPNEYKAEIIAAVEDKTGRDFSIESDIDLKLGLTPSFAVDGVRISNAPWGSRPDMISVGKFAAEVALLPLISGNLQINRLILRDAEFLIETDAEGTSNLNFAGTDNTEDTGGEAPNIPQINDVVVENAVLTLINGTQGTTTKLDIKRLSAKAASLSAPLEIDIAGVATLDGQPIEFGANGELGAPNTLLASDEAFPFDLTVTGLGLTTKIGGTIADLKNVQGMDFKLEITGDGLQGLAPLAGSELPAGGPVALSAGVKGNIDNPALQCRVV